MTPTQLQKKRLLRVAILLIAVAAGLPARAQDEEEGGAENENQPQAVMFVAGGQQFDQWVFGQVGGEAAARKKLASILGLRIEDVDRTCHLTASQKKKLLLAGQGDIKRFFDRVSETKKRIEKIKNDQNKLGEVWQEAQPLQNSLNGKLFNEDSLFTKTVKRTLDGDQVVRHERLDRQRRAFRYHATVGWVLVTLDKGVGLSDDQRQRLEKLIIDETRPPRKFGQYDYYFVLNQVARLPASKIKPILDNAQWRLLTQQLEQAKGMEMFLKNQGYLDESEPAERPAPVLVEVGAEQREPAAAKEKRQPKKDK